jgi:hypothetical protein
MRGAQGCTARKLKQTEEIFLIFALLLFNLNFRVNFFKREKVLFRRISVHTNIMQAQIYYLKTEEPHQFISGSGLISSSSTYAYMVLYRYTYSSNDTFST